MAAGSASRSKAWRAPGGSPGSTRAGRRSPAAAPWQRRGSNAPAIQPHVRPCLPQAQRAPKAPLVPASSVDASTAVHLACAAGSPAWPARRRAAGSPGAPACPPGRPAAAPARRSCVGLRPVVRDKGGVEAPHAGIAAGQRHLGDGQGGVGQQLLGRQQAACLQVLQGRHAERASKMRRRCRSLTPRRAARRSPTAPPSASQASGSSSSRAAWCARMADASWIDQPAPAAPARAGSAGRAETRAFGLRGMAKKRQFSRLGVRTLHTGRQ
jgi:hypothetical protein